MFQNTALHFLSNSEKMLKGINNNTSPFSMENLLSREKLSPESLDLNERTSEDHNRISLEAFKMSHERQRLLQEKKSATIPLEITRADGESDRLTPNEKNDLFSKFNNCFKSRICSNCGRFDCNLFQCRMNENVVIKDQKPVLKFSVSAILGNEHQQPKHVQAGKW